jgi:uracil-DNA glycosylase family 4
MTAAKENRFSKLIERVQACRKCSRMNESARVLGSGCGPLAASLIFIGEAPGRLGADGSHIPFHGDKSGHNFEQLLEQVGISRYEAFVTNAVLCNPKDESGNNATPTPLEISNCSPFLEEQLQIIEPKLVVTLGAVALKACSLIEPHNLSLKSAVRTRHKWHGTSLIPVYHPGQRAMVHRSFANQLSDYQFIAESRLRSNSGRRLSKINSNSRPDSASKLAQITRRILETRPNGISYFALHKLYFLAEVAHMDAVGERLTNSYVVRQKEGPYCVDLHLSKLQKYVPELIFDKYKHNPVLRLRNKQLFDDADLVCTLGDVELRTVDEVVNRFGSLSDAELKRKAYLSGPMRALLRKERTQRINLFNAAVLPYKPRLSSPASA